MKFTTLWDNHPCTEPEEDRYPCKRKNSDGNYHHGSQCAISMGVCFARSQVSIDSMPQKTNYCGGSGHGREHPVTAEQFANWIADSKFPFLEKVE